MFRSYTRGQKIVPSLFFNCSKHWFLRLKDGHLPSLTMHVYWSRQHCSTKALNQLLCEKGLILFPLVNPRGHGLRNPIKSEEGRQKNRVGWQAPRKRAIKWLYSDYSLEQRIKVQEGGEQEGQNERAICYVYIFWRGEGNREVQSNHFAFFGRTLDQMYMSSYWNTWKYENILILWYSNCATEILTLNIDSRPLPE